MTWLLTFNPPYVDPLAWEVREVEIHAEDAAGIDIKPVAEPERRVLVKPPEKFFFRPQRRLGRDWLHPCPRRTLAILPPEIVVEVKASLLARTIEKSPCNMDYLRMIYRIEDFLGGVDGRIVIAKKALPRHMRSHVIHIVLERQLSILILEFHV